MEYQELLNKISSLQARQKNYKRSLKQGVIDSKEGIEKQLYDLQVELDVLMLMRIQHELLSYLRDGGLPSSSYDPTKGLYMVGIPGSDTVAYVNPHGLTLIREYTIEHGNQKAAELLCSKNEV